VEDTKTIELAVPVEFGNTTYDKLELREPTVGEVTKAFDGKTGMAAGALLLSLVTGIPRGGIEKLPMRVFVEASDFLGHFTAGSPTTSET
jgi:hypothetical protein